jgi:hypothetical protein
MGLCISSQAHSKFGHLRLRARGIQMKSMLAAIAQNLRLLVSVAGASMTAPVRLIRCAGTYRRDDGA